ncbi:MAG: hypothetical protein HOY71_24485 [Nonomuraea sp.]|nr:hypothetical protein [Nonomuraea sp.]
MAELATEHRADLDAAARLMTAYAGVGGGATHFTANLATQRGSLQSALVVALGSLAGATHLATPALPTVATPLPAAPGLHRGIEPEDVAELVAELERASTRLMLAGLQIRRELATLDLPASPGWTIMRAGEWADLQAPDLRRRLDRIRGQRPARMIPADVAAYDLFGAYAAHLDPDALLGRVAVGDQSALDRLLAMRDPALPYRVNAWWRRLGPGARPVPRRLRGIGSLNGLPWQVRDKVNRERLAAEKARVELSLRQVYGASIVADLAALNLPPSLMAHDEDVSLLTSLGQIEDEMATGDVQSQLLTFEPHTTGQLAVAWGDPKHHDVTVTFVAGLRVGMRLLIRDLAHARILGRETRPHLRSTRMTVIGWGACFPIGTAGAGPPLEDRARDLAAFSDALAAARPRGLPGRNVVLGVGDGTLITGQACLLRPGGLADDVIGLPGRAAGNPSGAVLRLLNGE